MALREARRSSTIWAQVAHVCRCVSISSWRTKSSSPSTKACRSGWLSLHSMRELLSDELIQLLLQLLTGTREARHHRPERNLRNGRDLPVSETFDFMQHQDFTRLDGKLL